MEKPAMGKKKGYLARVMLQMVRQVVGVDSQ
jgi:hypothetical protein